MIATEPIPPTAPAASAPIGWRPYVGLVGVMLGSMIATLGTRITIFGLADLRGSLGAGFDEGAWITTAFGLGQLISGISSPYLASVVGGRRVLLAGVAVSFFAFLLAPLSHNIHGYLAGQFVAGLGTGTFIPLTIMFIMRHLPKPLLPYGIAIYAMNLEISLNVSASLEGFYIENWSWRWLSWQYCLALLLMCLCVWIGMPRDRPNREAIKNLDGAGLVYAWLGLGAFYVALDQGNRLDWTGDGLVVAMLVIGVLSVIAFITRELTVSRPALDLRLLAAPGILVMFLLLAGFRFIILSTAYVIPTYLQILQNYRALDIGAVLVWIAAPQIFLVLPLAMLIQRVDPRWTLGAGAALIAIACLMVTQLTGRWATPDFLPSQILQAVGQSLALTSLVALVARTVRPEQAATIGAFMQTSRLLGGEAGIAFMETFVRMREQIHSNLLGLHVQGQAVDTANRISEYGRAIAGQLATASQTAEAKIQLLATTVAQQAYVLAFVDAFEATAAVAVFCWVLAVFAPRSPKPAEQPAKAPSALHEAAI
jgi:MFS transporter, DHA2 family, multidrug resistance protein